MVFGLSNIYVGLSWSQKYKLVLVISVNLSLNLRLGFWSLTDHPLLEKYGNIKQIILAYLRLV